MFNHQAIEKKWQNFWENHQTFKTDVWDFSKPKFYALDMFPYPSGNGLHVGHPEGYTASDIICRKKRMEGFNVLHPMGFDSFGLPAEQYAIQTGNHPEGFTHENIKIFTAQLNSLGFSFDWSKALATSDPSFYKWTQWIFIQLYKDGLAKIIDFPVNWCEELGTVLANDEIIDGKSERGGHPVVRKMMKQWVIDIVKYADRLLVGLDDLDWPESTKEIQRHWIGKSQGALITFRVADKEASFEVFTTRADTLFGATYCVLAPEHELVRQISTADKTTEIANYIANCASKSDLERTELNKEKTGVFTGAYALNPVNNQKMPIWISDYVLAAYGTGAIMAVPAHDQRDYEFAKKFNLEIIQVLDGPSVDTEAMEEDGTHINSDFLNGLNKEEALVTITAWLESRNIGRAKVNYRLREWIFARQRYWGEPIPICHFEDGSSAALREEELPLTLPIIDNYKGSNGSSPLVNAHDWVHVIKEGKKGQLETNTMPGSAGSSWYYLRFIDPKNDKELADPKLIAHWMPVDLYIGGPEHVVGHLLYSRMWNNYLFDKGIVHCKEPFKKLFHQGMILGENNEKMSKSRGNVVNPDVIVKNYGADALRVFEMFMGPLEASKPWSDKGVEGSRKWLDRVWRLFIEMNVLTDERVDELEYSYHFMVKKVSHDIETLNMNTAISAMMIFINDCYKVGRVNRLVALNFVKILSCFAPHVAEEIYQLLGKSGTITYETWPTYDESKIVLEEIEVAVQVNGKLRGKFVAKTNEDEAVLKQIALEVPNVQSFIIDKEIIKIFVIKGRVINIVVK